MIHVALLPYPHQATAGPAPPASKHPTRLKLRPELGPSLECVAWNFAESNRNLGVTPAEPIPSIHVCVWAATVERETSAR